MESRNIMIKWIDEGVTRWVLCIGNVAIKFPKNLRGWLANESEWRQRKRSDVNRPYISILHFIIIYPRASEVGDWDPEDCPHDVSINIEHKSNEEKKGSSWGLFKDKWLLIDFDRAWERPRSLIGFFYYYNQERLYKKWSKLPRKDS